MQARRVHTQCDWNSIRRAKSTVKPDRSLQSRSYPRATEPQWWRLSLSFNRQHCSKHRAILRWLKPYHDLHSVVSWVSLRTLDIAMDTTITAHTSMAASSLQNIVPQFACSCHSRHSRTTLPFLTETAKLNNQIWPTLRSLRLLSPTFWFRSRFPPANGM